jgi:hypothetical protein
MGKHTVTRSKDRNAWPGTALMEGGGMELTVCPPAFFDVEAGSEWKLVEAES